MKKIDIITAAGRAYQTCWAERAYLLKLAMVPFFLKFLCFIIGVGATDGDVQSLRFTLIMVPAYLAEGWMLAHFARLLVLGQRWPFRPSGDLDADLAVLKIRARGVLSGMIVFVLINLALGFLLYLVNEYMVPYMPKTPDAPPQAVPAPIIMMTMAMIAFLVWGFRLLWLYIPYALNIRPEIFLISMRGFMIFLQMIALWILCFVPFLVGMQLMASVFSPVVEQVFGAFGKSFVYIFLNVLMDTLKGLTATAGMVFAWMQLYRPDAAAKV